jgi:hypothetical protein
MRSRFVVGTIHLTYRSRLLMTQEHAAISSLSVVGGGIVALLLMSGLSALIN